MAGMIELDLRPDERTLRQFGFIAFVGFGLLAVLAWQEWLLFSAGLGHARIPVAACLSFVGVASASLSVVAPRANLALYVGLSLLAFPIGLVLSHVILAILYYLLFTPVALVFRTMGRDPLNRRFQEDVSSYWQDARPPRPRDSYFKQF